MGQAASERARAEFTWTGIARRLIDVIDRAATVDALTPRVAERSSSGIGRLAARPGIASVRPT
jgi:hypothetical protein